MKILVPTDFSENARHAVLYALSLAKEKSGSTIRLVHVINPVVTDTLVIEDVKKEANLALDKICKELTSQYRGCIITSNVKIGDTIDEILKEAKDINVGMIVMGLRNDANKKRFLFGTHGMSLLYRSTFPILFVPETAIITSPRRIVFATDYYRNDINALQRVIPLANAFHAEIKIIHLFEKKQDAPMEMGFLQLVRTEVSKVINYPRLMFGIFNCNDIALGIRNFCKATEANLLVLSTPNRSFLKRFFHKSITKELAYNTLIPLLIFKLKKVNSA